MCCLYSSSDQPFSLRWPNQYPHLSSQLPSAVPRLVSTFVLRNLCSESDSWSSSAPIIALLTLSSELSVILFQIGCSHLSNFAPKLVISFNKVISKVCSFNKSRGTSFCYSALHVIVVNEIDVNSSWL